MCGFLDGNEAETFRFSFVFVDRGGLLMCKRLGLPHVVAVVGWGKDTDGTPYSRLSTNKYQLIVSSSFQQGLNPEILL